MDHQADSPGVWIRALLHHGIDIVPDLQIIQLHPRTTGYHILKLWPQSLAVILQLVQRHISTGHLALSCVEAQLIHHQLAGEAAAVIRVG